MDASFNNDKSIELDFSFPVLKIMKSYPDFEGIDFHDFILYPYQDKELYCRIINLYNLYKNINHFDSINEKFKSYLLNLSHDVYAPVKLIKMQMKHLSNNLEIKSFDEILESVLSQLDNITDVLLSVPYSSIALDSLLIEKNISFIDIVDLISNVVKQLSFYAATQGINVVYNNLDEKPFVRANYTYIWRMVYNLLFNAIKYSLGRGIVRLTLLKDDETLKFLVVDTGVGMTPEQLSIVRKYLMSSDEEENSRFGRGMVIIKFVANYLKATVNIDSEMGVGTTFTIEFSNVEWSI
ncbi:hypothetical protein CAL7716_100640 (plasmid) [Calothrix sp. PCC 7716]|nr:hypothetical protein CAL7716_100640 [Calothrix sp. PCC 7716]